MIESILGVALTSLIAIVGYFFMRDFKDKDEFKKYCYQKFELMISKLSTIEKEVALIQNNKTYDNSKLNHLAQKFNEIKDEIDKVKVKIQEEKTNMKEMYALIEKYREIKKAKPQK